MRLDILFYALSYLHAVITDGDTLNDWLTHVDHETAARLELMGQALARMLELVR